MNTDDVPGDFPQEFLEAVSGAQPKLLVRKSQRGEYISEAQSLRAERWAICVDICEQLVDYVNKHWTGEGHRHDYVEKVVRALNAKRMQWGISHAETAWIAVRLRAAMSPGAGRT
jgi:hypothetical protein